jgi:hypothetical protein
MTTTVVSFLSVRIFLEGEEGPMDLQGAALIGTGTLPFFGSARGARQLLSQSMRR